MTCTTCHPLHARGLKRGRGTWFGLILDSGAQNVFEGRRGLEMVIEGRILFLKGAEGWGW